MYPVLSPRLWKSTNAFSSRVVCICFGVRFSYESALGWHTLTSKNAGCSLSQKPRVRISSRASGALLKPLDNTSPVTSWRTGSTSHVSAYCLKHFSLEISYFIVTLYSESTPFTNHCMIDIGHVPAYTHAEMECF